MDDQSGQPTVQLAKEPAKLPQNPLLLKIRIPGETFRMPSGGIFYDDNELSDGVENGEVHILPMTTIDEIIMKTPDKLFTGEAITEVFSRCIPQILKPMNLLTKDVDFLLVCLRKLSYGQQFEIKWKHDCDDAKENNYNISLDPFISNAKSIDPTRITNDYTLHFDETDQTVHLRPPRFIDVLKLYQAVGDEETDAEELRDKVTASVVGVIRDVDGISDPDLIIEWLKAVPVKFIHDINKAIEKMGDWGPNFDTPLECKDCGEKITIPTPLNPIAFFI